MLLPISCKHNTSLLTTKIIMKRTNYGNEHTPPPQPTKDVGHLAVALFSTGDLVAVVHEMGLYCVEVD